MENQFLLEILKTLQQMLKMMSRSLPQRQGDISLAATDFIPGYSFTLYVGVEGTVVGIDEEDQPFNRHFIAGYHSFSCKQITKIGTSATSLAAMRAVTL